MVKNISTIVLKLRKCLSLALIFAFYFQMVKSASGENADNDLNYLIKSSGSSYLAEGYGQLFQFNRKLTIYNQNHQKIVDFTVAIADRDLKRQIGLMQRKSLSKNSGMLFIFDRPQMIKMWMKDTFISLDMLFIRSNKIIKIAESSMPMSQNIISSQQDADMVLEINAGLSKALNLKVGDEIRLIKLDHQSNLGF